MKNLLSIIFIGAIVTTAFSNEYIREWKTPIHVEMVPADVKETFVKNHSDNPEAVWFPYPYGTNQINEVEGFFTPKSLDDEAEYFEAEFIKNGKTLRKVYDQEGECRMIVHVKELADAPYDLLRAFDQSDFEGWDLLSYEVVRLAYHGTVPFHKFFLTRAEETQVVYFNTNLELEKQIKWEHHNFTEYNGAKTVVKTAYQGLREKGEIQDMSWAVRVTLNETMKRTEILEYWEIAPIHIPEQREALEFYDIQLGSLYEVVYEKKKKLMKNTYNEKGVLLETVELVSLNNAPAVVNKHRTNKKYRSWAFENKVEKVTLADGSHSYRLHAIQNGNPYVMVIHSK